MTEAFASLVYPVFHEVIGLLGRIERGEAASLEDEKARIMTALDEAEQKAAASSLLARDYALAKHALVYWADEVLINSPWSHAFEWRQHILEWDYYRDRSRADAFFERLAEAERLETTDPLETFFFALALGFRGRLADSPGEHRELVLRLYNRVSAGNQQPDRFLPDEAAPREPLRPLPGKTILLAVSVLVSLTVLFTLACFVLAVPPTSG